VGSPPVDALAASVAAHVRAIRDTASSSPPGGGPAWDGLLRHYGLTPFEPQERAMAVQYLRLVRGAAPGEVRMALASLSAWGKGELGRLQAAAPPAELQGLGAWIDALVDRETREYEASIGVAPPPAALSPALAPAGPSLASIFANAEQTSKEVPWANMKYETVATLTCVHCGGPQEKPADFMCKYCRRPIAGSFV
jgi:hypothetical protein